MRVLITGAGGFIGSRTVKYLLDNTDLCIRAMPGRTGMAPLSKDPKLESSPGRDINEDTMWSDALAEVDAVLHLAARAHVLDESADRPLDLFRKVNVKGSLNLARQAARAGVKRFVFISSIGVNGSQSFRPFTADDPPNPDEPYAVSKLEAEQKLHGLSKKTGMEIVVIRPPLVYGPNAPGNFGRLVKLVEKGLPLPLGAVRNKRSLVALDNLADLISVCINHPLAAGETFLVSDGRDLSTPELIRKLASAMGKNARLIPVPPLLLRMAGRMTGKSAAVEKLISSLQVDISHTCKTLNWQPPVSVKDALRDAVRKTAGKNQPPCREMQ